LAGRSLIRFPHSGSPPKKSFQPELYRSSGREPLLSLFRFQLKAGRFRCNSVPDISGVWKGTIQASAAGGKDKWQGPAELTLNQNGNALTGTLVFTHPQAGRVQVPITSGIVSKDAVTFSGQNQFPLGGSIQLTFHGNVSGTSLTGTTDMTSRGLFGTVTNTGPLTLSRQ
ncbi:MAG TPA: hypothetical protein VKX49_20870, partial [Bryobacteraceae bacterium]|nr:hypothetical protein [Bryobacteraceae bacterium]